MTPRREASGGASRYFFGFTFTTLLLGGLTLFLVLVVLPRRYMLSVGLVESGTSFPSEAAPFAPPEEVQQEAQPLPPPPPVIPKGPAELFWDSVDPLLAAGRLEEALPLFARYLSEYPEDNDVRREQALTLSRAGHPQEAVRVFQTLLSDSEDPDLRLLLARSLRDLGRLNEASEQYAVLLEKQPEDSALALEWGKALAWGKRYDTAATVLEDALTRFPSSGEIRLELAKVYYWSDQLDAADRVLEGMEGPYAQSAEVVALRQGVTAALTPPEPAEEPADSLPPSLLDQATQAMADQDYEMAAELLSAAAAEAPDDVEILRTQANVLQYQLDDLEGARETLLKVETLIEPDLALRFRLAQLDMWTGRNQMAEARLQGILEDLESESAAPADATVPAEADSVEAFPAGIDEVRAMLGDLRRWSGDRVQAADLYQDALVTDSTNQRAEAGLREVEAETDEAIHEFEEPGVGIDAYAIRDTDDFSQVDLGTTGVRFMGTWLLRVRAGQRWLEGNDLFGSLENQQGQFLELAPARWWRQGTIRTGVRLGLERIRAGKEELTLGASLHFGDLGGFRTDVTYEHGPAYPLLLTLQSLESGVTQDRISAALSRAFGPRWSLFVAADATRVHSSATETAGAATSLRFAGSASLGRTVRDGVTLGLNASALTFTRAAPTPNDIRLFWDPRSMVAGGLYAQLMQPINENWSWNVRANPGLAFIDERRGIGSSLVPHFSTEGGITHLGDRFRTELSAFYYQGRFDGYNAYGLRISVTARDWLTGWRNR